jgi:hypothetical protein
MTIDQLNPCQFNQILFQIRNKGVSAGRVREKKVFQGTIDSLLNNRNLWVSERIDTESMEPTNSRK